MVYVFFLFWKIYVMLNIPFIMGFFAAKQMLELSFYPFAFAVKATDAAMRPKQPQ